MSATASLIGPEMPPAAISTRLVHTLDGPLTVAESEDLIIGRGIRYGSAKRFAPPVPLAPWNDPRDALRAGSCCPQVGDRLGHLLGDVAAGLDPNEDCLVLSVTAPRNAAKLPVMIFFHGGAYMVGAGESAKYNPANLAREGNVVVVTITYRLGIFGYLPTALGGDEKNLGLRDQLLALQWVTRNIASFGGDPGNVTLFGQSAGGDSILSLLLCDAARGLCRRAILQSAPLGLREGRGSMIRAVAAAADRALAARPNDLSTEDMLEVQKIAVAAAAPFGLHAGLPLGNIPGAFPLPSEEEAPHALARIAADVDLLIFHIRDDALPFVQQKPRYARLSRLGAFGANIQKLLGRAVTHLIFARPGARLAKDWAAAGGMLGEYAGCLNERLAVGRDLRAAWARFARDGTMPASSPALRRLS